MRYWKETVRSKVFLRSAEERIVSSMELQRRKKVKAIDVALMLFALVLLFSFCTGCGPKSTTHTVQGEATVKVVISVDTSICDGMEPAAKTECIQSLLDLATAANGNKEESGLDGIY